MSILGSLLISASGVAPPFASAVKFDCQITLDSGRPYRFSGEIDPIVEATGYGSAKIRILKDESGLMRNAKSALMTGSPKPPRWYQATVPTTAGREYGLQLYLFPNGSKGHAFIMEQQDGLKTGAFRTMAVGLCSSDIVSNGTLK
jgi:hypothetical protein